MKLRERLSFLEMEREFDGKYIKKGPWTAEEDEVLINHVKKYGPRDWSFIRSKGLLPRTGKSCRLRWVNKLKPNLKIGCKFSAEEESVVIELQAQFGNKWAKIATYLQGRTDNDVKNFWSSRRKRLERMLQRPSPSKPQKNKGKAPIHQALVEQVPSSSSNQLEENPSSFNYLSSCPTSCMGNSEAFQMVKLPGSANPNFPNLEVEAIPLHMIPSFESSSDQYTFSQLPESVPQLDFPPLPESFDFPHDPFDPKFFDMFEQQKGSESVCSQKLGNAQSTSPNDFFQDFPAEIFDYFENLPASSLK